ncbi:MAG: hypothetical protein ACI4PJ_01810 [Acutalibacteraceae bacterium]
MFKKFLLVCSAIFFTSSQLFYSAGAAGAEDMEIKSNSQASQPHPPQFQPHPPQSPWQPPQFQPPQQGFPAGQGVGKQEITLRIDRMPHERPGGVIRYRDICIVNGQKVGDYDSVENKIIYYNDFNEEDYNITLEFGAKARPRAMTRREFQNGRWDGPAIKKLKPMNLRCPSDIKTTEDDRPYRELFYDTVNGKLTGRYYTDDKSFDFTEHIDRSEYQIIIHFQ